MAKKKQTKKQTKKKTASKAASRAVRSALKSLATPKKKDTFKVTLEFDTPDAAGNFFASWLDGGADGGGNQDWHTEKWDKDHTWMRIKGTGYPVEFEDGEAIVMTPEVESERFEERLKKIRGEEYQSS